MYWNKLFQTIGMCFAARPGFSGGNEISTSAIAYQSQGILRSSTGEGLILMLWMVTSSALTDSRSTSMIVNWMKNSAAAGISSSVRWIGSSGLVVSPFSPSA